MFRAKYVAKLRKANIAPHAFTQRLFEKEWVVYAKRPFGNTHSMIEYMGRYTHKVAISNHRILSVEDGKVRFEYKDYRKNGKKGVMELSAGVHSSWIAFRFLLKTRAGEFMSVCERNNPKTTLFPVCRIPRNKKQSENCPLSSARSQRYPT